MDIQWRHGCAKDNECHLTAAQACPLRQIASATMTVRRAVQQFVWPCGSTVVRLRSSAAGSTARTARRGMMGEWSSPDVKSRAGRRTVGIPHPVAHAIERPRERQAVERTRAGNLWREESWVFTNHLGGPVHPTVDYEAWKALLRRAKVSTARLHDGRHTAAIMLQIVLKVPCQPSCRSWIGRMPPWRSGTRRCRTSSWSPSWRRWAG